METRALRTAYMPATTDVLLIGESPPDGGTFFFAGDSRLFLSTKAAFERFLKTTYSEPSEFLAKFKAMRFHLVDLCETPVNKVPERQRKLMREAGVDSLVKELKHHKPQALIVIMSAIVGPVLRATERAGLASVPRYTLPFPAYQHTPRYEKELLAALVDLESRGIISAR